MAKEPYNPALRAAFFEVVDNQIRDGTPPETRLTLERLMAEGRSKKEARELIAVVVATEIFEVMKNKEPFQESRFVAALKALPRLPEDE